MHVYLKVKIKSLTAEAQLIRLEERKININARQRKHLARNIHFRNYREGYNANAVIVENLDDYQVLRLQKKLERSRNILNNPNSQARLKGLHDHRTKDLRKEARSSFIAYGFLRGNTYATIEGGAGSRPDWKRIEEIIKKFSEEDSRIWKQKFAEFASNSGW